MAFLFCAYSGTLEPKLAQLALSRKFRNQVHVSIEVEPVFLYQIKGFCTSEVGSAPEEVLTLPGVNFPVVGLSHGTEIDMETLGKLLGDDFESDEALEIDGSLYYPRKQLIGYKELDGEGKEAEELSSAKFSKIEAGKDKKLDEVIVPADTNAPDRSTFKTPRSLYIMVDEVVEVILDDEYKDAKLQVGTVDASGTFTADSDPEIDKHIVGGTLEDGAYVKLKRVTDPAGPTYGGIEIRSAKESKKFISLEINGELHNLVDAVVLSGKDIGVDELEIVVVEAEVKEDEASESHTIADDPVSTAEVASGKPVDELLGKIVTGASVTGADSIIGKSAKQEGDATAATTAYELTAKIRTYTKGADAKTPGALETGDKVVVDIVITPMAGYVLGTADPITSGSSINTIKIDSEKFTFTAPSNGELSDEVRTTARYTATVTITL